MSAQHGLLSIEDFRQLFQPPLSKDMVYGMVKDKKLSVVKPGRRKYFVPASEAQRILNKYEVQ